MKIETDTYKLTNEFWQDYPHEKHAEILRNERKQERPYILAIDEKTQQKFAIPLRSNAKHEFVYKFKESSRIDEQGKPIASKIDFSKAIPIFKDNHIKKDGIFDRTEVAEMEENKEKIEFLAEKFFKTWRKNELENKNQIANENSPIKYFKYELGWSREQQLEKQAHKKETLKDLTLTSLKERLTNIDTELKTLQDNKPIMQSETVYTKQAYNILTQGESTKILEQIKDARHIRNPSAEIKQQIENYENKLDEIIAKYPDEQVSNLINDLKSRDEEKTKLFNLACKELNNEKIAIKGILSQSPASLSATLDKTIQEHSGQDNMLTSLKDKATNIITALVEWQNDAVLKDNSKEVTKKNDLER